MLEHFFWNSPYTLVVYLLHVVKPAYTFFIRLVSLQGRVVATKYNNILWLWVIRSVCLLPVFLVWKIPSFFIVHFNWLFGIIMKCSFVVLPLCVSHDPQSSANVLCCEFLRRWMFSLLSNKKKSLSLNPFGIVNNTVAFVGDGIENLRCSKRLTRRKFYWSLRRRNVLCDIRFGVGLHDNVTCGTRNDV